MAKRANGEGTVTKRIKNGKLIGWRSSVTVGYDANGKQIRRWVSGKTQAEVTKALQDLKTERDAHNPNSKSDLSVTTYLREWTEAKTKAGIKPNTVRSYRDTTRLYLTPLIGHITLRQLQPSDVQQMANKMVAAGKSPAQIRYTLQILRMALNQAVIWEYIPKNAAQGIKGPQREIAEFHCWSEVEVKQFLKAAEKHRMYAAFFLAVMTGMRRGEVLGLKWENIDWERKRLLVRNNLVENRHEGIPGKKIRGQLTVSTIQVTLQTPKTTKSRRTVILSPGTIEVLKKHRQVQQLEKEQLGPDYQENNFVFANEFGECTAPRTLYGWFKQLIEEAQVPEIRFHDLRHTAASLMIQRGLPPKVVSDRLGHTDVAFTLRVYAHLYDEQREEAAFDLDEHDTGPGDDVT